MTELAHLPPAEPIPAFTGQVPGDLRQAIRQAVDAWLLRTPSPHTRRAYRLDLDQFLAASGIQPDAWEQLAAIRPEHVSQWRLARATTPALPLRTAWAEAAQLRLTSLLSGTSKSPRPC